MTGRVRVRGRVRGAGDLPLVRRLHGRVDAVAALVEEEAPLWAGALDRVAALEQAVAGRLEEELTGRRSRSPRGDHDRGRAGGTD